MRSTFGMLMMGMVLALSVGCGKKDSTGAGGGGGGTASLEGTYLLVEMDFMGMKKTEADMKSKSDEDRTFVIKGNQIIAKKGGKDDPATFTTDASKSPPQIDIVNKESGKDEKMFGIYKLDGDTLTLCLVMSDKPEDRPKDFVIAKDDKTLGMMMVLKKKK